MHVFVQEMARHIFHVRYPRGIPDALSTPRDLLLGSMQGDGKSLDHTIWLD